MTFVSFAQNFEDVILWRALRHVEQGQYLDIGAQDPVLDSVSLAFYQAGWRGIHVEATPLYCAKLREARRDEIVIQAAATDVVGPIEFYEIPDTGISTGRSDVAMHHQRAGFHPQKILVPTVRLDQLLEMFEGEIHWMKIDVEGMEHDALRSWGECRKRPWILVIEGTFPSTQMPNYDAWVSEVEKRGYRNIFFDGLSYYFIHSERGDLEHHFNAPANVFDRFVVTSQHFSANGLRDEIAKSQRDLEAEHLLGERLSAELRSAIDQLEATREDNSRTLKRMVGLEQDHRAATEAFWAQRIAAEEALRREGRERREELRRESSRREEALRREAAQREERLLQREAELIQKASVAEARAAEQSRMAGRFEERSVQFRAAVDQIRVDMADRLSEARLATSKAQDEREQAFAELRASKGANADLAAQLDHARRSIEILGHDIRDGARDGSGGRFRLGRLLGVRRSDPRWEALAARYDLLLNSSQSGCSGTGIYDESSSPGTQVTISGVGNPYLRANSLAELLGWNDLDFVRCAYVTILGRQPDPEGESYYVQRIRAGHSKEEVLWQLRRCPEGRDHDPGIAGLDRALKSAARARRPFTGAIFRTLFGGESDQPLVRRIRRLENEFATARRYAPILLPDGLAPSERAISAANDQADPPQPARTAANEPPVSLSGYQRRIFRQLGRP